MNKSLTPEELCIRRVKKQRSKIYLSAPGTFTMMGGLPIVVTEKVRTFATDGWTIFVNRPYCDEQTDMNIRGIIIHEGLHVALLHNTRRGDFHPELWNQGCDYKVNGWIKQSENYGIDFTLPDGLLWDDFYSNCDWSVEKICNDMLSKGWEPSEDGEQPDCGPGEVLDSPATEDGDEEQILEEEREILDRVFDASLVEKSMGKEEGGFCNKIKESQGKTTSAEIIRQFIIKHFSSKRSFKRPNRRFLHKKIYLPSRERTAHTLHVTIDSSASVGITEFQQYRKNMVRFARDLGLSKIRVAYVDTYIHKNPKTNEPWYDIDLRQGTGAEAMELDVYGGGGTSFDPIFEYLKINKQESEVGAMVYFTDGYGSVEMRKTPYPVLWVSSGVKPDFYDSRGENEKGFGRVVYI